MSDYKKFLLRSLVALCVIFMLIICISKVQEKLLVIRKDAQLTEIATYDNVSPTVAFTTVALGGFRGLLADYLWLRSTQMQDDGNYFEMYQLASWIAKLQPRSTDSQAFLSWNMSYNISVTFSNHEERWRWVLKGIELLRDEALAYNPSDPKLYQQLGWVFQHKIGANLDDANLLYKIKWATIMANVMGKERFPGWEKLANAPKDIIELNAYFKANFADDKDLFWESLKEAKLDFKSLEIEFRKTSNFSSMKKYDKLYQILNGSERGKVIENCLRRRWFKDVYKLDTHLIHQINKTYGWLDWRLADPQSIYWATKGREIANDKLSLECERMIFQGLMGTLKTGILVQTPDGKFDFRPNFAVLDTLQKQFEEVGKKFKRKYSKAPYENFLIDAAVLLYSYSRLEKAEEYRKLLLEKFGNENLARRLRYSQSLDNFIFHELTDDAASIDPEKIVGVIKGLLSQACVYLAQEKMDKAFARERKARELYNRYMKDIKGTEFRRGLVKYSVMRDREIDSFIVYLKKLGKNELATVLTNFRSQLGGNSKSSTTNEKKKQP